MRVKNGTVRTSRVNAFSKKRLFILGFLVLTSGRAQYTKVFSVCDVIERRHSFAAGTPMRVSGVLEGDGALHGDCGRSMRVQGLLRTKAINLSEAAASIRRATRLPEGAMTLTDYYLSLRREMQAKGISDWPERKITGTCLPPQNTKKWPIPGGNEILLDKSRILG